MKRYRMRIKGVLYATISHDSDIESVGDPNGEWVKWEDVKDIITLNLDLMGKIRQLRTTTITSDDGTLKVKDVTEMFIADWWVCPKHEYKRR